MPDLFEYLNSINTTKIDLMESAQDEKDFNQFMIMRGLSLFNDTLMFANEMNKYRDLPNRMVYDFYRHGISKRKRFSKWPKKEIQSDDLELICNYLLCSYSKGKEYLKIFTETQLAEIRQITNTGGTLGK